MLRLSGGQVESLFDLGLPVEVRELPADLAGLDRLLSDPALLEPVERVWDAAAWSRSSDDPYDHADEIDGGQAAVGVGL
jgi:hypothetical protein